MRDEPISNRPVTREPEPTRGRARLPADYPPPLVDHAERRELVLARFRTARESAVQT